MQDGNTLVHLAAMSGSVEVMKWLSTHRGINKTSLNQKGQSNAVLAVIHGRTEMLDFLYHNWSVVDINEVLHFLLREILFFGAEGGFGTWH